MSRYAVLLGRIQQQLKELQLEYDYAVEQANLAATTQIDAYWIAAGFGLQGYYTHRLDPSLIAQNVSLLPDCQNLVLQDIRQFRQFLETVANNL